jgi:hypothetical protein
MVIRPGTTSSRMRNSLEEWLFRQELPAHGWGILWRNGNSARNYQLTDEEFSGGMIIPPGTTSSRMRNSLEERLFRQEPPAHGWGIFCGGMVIPSEITGSWTLCFWLARSKYPINLGSITNNSRISNNNCSLPRMSTFFKEFKCHCNEKSLIRP